MLSEMHLDDEAVQCLVHAELPPDEMREAREHVE
jgi:hypothetical protein